MNEKDFLEENIHKLIKAGSMPRPNLEEEKSLYRNLLRNIKKTADTREFPWQAMLALSTLLLILAGWMLFQALGLTGAAGGPGLLAVGLLVLANLALLPVAGIAIVIRRRHA